MFPSQVSIILYGRDAVLLETRRQVLELSGARIWATTSLSGFDQIVRAVSIDIIILCHSLSMEECGRAIAVASMRWPQVQSLFLTWGEFNRHPGFSGQIADAARGPAHLLHAVTKLVRAGQVKNSHSLTGG